LLSFIGYRLLQAQIQNLLLGQCTNPSLAIRIIQEFATNTDDRFRARGRHVTVSKDHIPHTFRRLHTTSSGLFLEMYSGNSVGSNRVQSTCSESTPNQEPTQEGHPSNSHFTQQNWLSHGRDRRQSTPTVKFSPLPPNQIRSRSLPPSRWPVKGVLSYAGPRPCPAQQEWILAGNPSAQSTLPSFRASQL
jgi:hypothetical protein